VNFFLDISYSRIFTVLLNPYSGLKTVSMKFQEHLKTFASVPKKGKNMTVSFLHE
jgi:hypothetical protein